MSQTSPTTEYRVVPIDKVVVVAGFNPRLHFDDDEIARMAQTIRERGMKQPLSVRVGTSGAYELVDGERRLRAARLAESEVVPIIIETHDESEVERAIDAGIANLHSSAMAPIDEALYYQRLKDSGLAQRGIVQRLGVRADRVRERLALLKLPESVWPKINARQVPLEAAPGLIVLASISPALPDLAVTAMLGQAGDEEPLTWKDFGEDPLLVLLSLVDAQQLPDDVFLVGHGAHYPIERFSLTDKAATDLIKLGRLRQREIAEWSFSAVDFQAAVALKAGLTTKDAWRGQIIVGQDVASQVVSDGISRELKRERERQRRIKELTPASNGSTSATDPASRQAEAAAQREAQAQQRREAAAFNVRLGAAILDKLSRVNVDARVLSILTAIDVGGTLTKLAMRGARYGFPGWQSESSKGVVRYLGPVQAAARAREFLTGAKATQDIAGRCVALIVMAIFADERAVAPSSRTHHVVEVGDLPWCWEVDAYIDALVAEQLPGGLLDDQLAERKQQREDAAAKRARIAALEAEVDALGDADDVTVEQLDRLAEQAKRELGEYSAGWYVVARKIEVLRGKIC